MRLALMISVAVFLSTHAWAGEHFENAKKLYDHGPSQAKAIIKELELELQESPDNYEALMLLAITQRGIGDFNSSQISLDKAEVILRKKETINPKLYLLRVENHLFLGEYDEAEKILTSMWAFFQGSDQLKNEYERLEKAIILGKSQKDDLSFVGHAAGYILSLKDRPLLNWVFVVVSSDKFDKLLNDKDVGVAIQIAQENKYDTVVAVEDKGGAIFHFTFFSSKQIKAYSTSLSDSSVKLITQPVTIPKEVVYESGTLSGDDGTPLSAYRVIQE